MFYIIPKHFNKSTVTGNLNIAQNNKIDTLRISKYLNCAYIYKHFGGRMTKQKTLKTERINYPQNITFTLMKILKKRFYDTKPSRMENHVFN